MYWLSGTNSKSKYILEFRDKFRLALSGKDFKGFALEVALWIFWYAAMFPGRVGYDTKISLEMLRLGDSTDWWTGWYWRILQVLTFNGQSIVFFTIFTYSLTIVSVYWVINAVTIKKRNRRILARFISAVPIIPVFGMTVQHDIFLLCGFLILFGLEIRTASKKYITKGKYFSLTLLILSLFVTTHQGLILAIYLVIRSSFFLGLRFIKTILWLLSLVAFTSLTSFGIENTRDRQMGIFIPLLMDVKCVVQDPDSAVGEDNWEVLTKILAREIWEQPYRCDEIDANDWLDFVDYSKINFEELAKSYLQIARDNGEIIFMAHVARSNYVLPPPFFHTPPNQVNLDFSRPIGEGTNAALQSRSPVLHPSIDDPYVNLKPKLLKPIEYLAQIPILMINQASWFWGWGGLWIWPILLYSLMMFKSKVWKTSATIFTPFLLLHLSLFTIGISASPRHVTSSVSIGIICFFAILINLGSRIRLSDESAQ